MTAFATDVLTDVVTAFATDVLTDVVTAFATDVLTGVAPNVASLLPQCRRRLIQKRSVPTL